MKVFNLGILLVLIFSNSVCFSQYSDIKVKISGVKEIKGNVYVYLFSSEKGFPTDLSKATQSKKIKAINKVASITFNDIKNGYYAITVYHDVNSNKKMDTNFVGIPKEPVGVSNNAKGFMGPPKYEEAKFYLKSDKQIMIQLNSE